MSARNTPAVAAAATILFAAGTACLFAVDGAWAGWDHPGAEQEKALALEGNARNGIKVFEVCATCHLPEGWGAQDGAVPQIAGQYAQVVIKQLADIGSLNRDNPAMYPFALSSEIGGLQAIADVAAYIETLPMTPSNGLGPWQEGTKNYEAGRVLYVENCVRCHGEMGEGSAAEFVPLLQGQHYNYLLRQFRWIREGKRRNANPEMVEQIKGFSDQQMSQVMNYVSRLQPEAERLAPSIEWTNPDF